MNYKDALKLASEAAKLGEDYDDSMKKARRVLESVPDDDLPATRGSGLCVTCGGCGDPECCSHDHECSDPTRIREKIAWSAVGPRPPKLEPPLFKVVYCPPEGKKREVSGSRFHARDGWFFRRLPAGAVEIVVQENRENGRVRERARFDASTWASIVAHVSREGETGDQYRAALDLHGGIDFK